MFSKLFSSEQVSEAAQEAIDNWDFDQVDNGPKQIAALKHLAQHPTEIELGRSFRDIWDWLAEFATNTAAGGGRMTENKKAPFRGLSSDGAA